MGIDTFLVSMQQEMYKDALHFLREARQNYSVDGDTFVTWRDIRATILFSFSAIESCINQFIDDYIYGNMAALMQKEVDYWTGKSGPVGINRKLNEGILLFGGKRLDADTALWRDYEELKDLRNSLVHYKVTNRLFYSTDEILKRTEKGLLTARAVIKKIYLAHPSNVCYPEIFDELP